MHASHNGSSRRPLGKPPGGYSAQDTARRRHWLQQHTGMVLDELPPPTPEELQGLIENHVGFVPMPLSIASPLMIEGTYARGEFAVPLCTIEGTLLTPA